MDLKQIKRLKLNSTNIQSALVSNNKRLKKIRSDENSFVRNQFINQKRSDKEQSIEKPPSKISRAIEFVKSRLISTPMSIFDKIKEFFALVLMGLLINQLPKIIKGLQEFFGKNPWIINGIKETIKNVGNGLKSLIDVVKMISDSVYENTPKQRKDIEDLINNIDSLLTGIENNLLGVIGNVIIGPPPPTVNNPDYSSFKSGGGMAALKKGSSVKEVIKRGKENINRYNSGPRSPTPAPALPSPLAPPSIPIQSFAKGGTVQKVPNTESNKKSINTRTFAKPGGTPSGRKAIKSAESFDKYKSNTVAKFTDIKIQENNNNLFEKLIENFKNLKSLMGDNKKGGGGGGGKEGNEIPLEGEVVKSDSSDFWLLSTVALYEGINQQGYADVAQVTYNRVGAPGDPWKTGGSIRSALLAPSQYTPVMRYGGPSAWGKIVDRESAVAFVKKNGKTPQQLDVSAAAILDPSKQSSAKTFIGPRDSFRSTSTENKSYNQLADDTEVTRNGHIFGFEPKGAQIEEFRKGKLKPANVPTIIEGEVITPYTPTELKGKNTAFQGSTGRSTGPHMHIGPMELLDPKTLAYVGKQSNQGLVDSRRAAFRVVKALIARKTRFVLSNLDVNRIYDPSRERLTDSQIQNLILAEQNAHISRSMESSWGGIDIVALGATDIPIPVGPVKYHPDGFGYRAQLLGTKGFVGHLTEGSKSTPLSQIEKPDVKPKIDPVIKQENLDRLKTVINSKPGSGEKVKIPGVGTYEKGRNVIGLPEDKYYDENGDRITKDEFYKRLERVKSQSNQISSASNLIEPNKLVKNNLQFDQEEFEQTIIIAQQPIITSGPPVPIPFPVKQRSTYSSKEVVNNQQSIIVRGLV
jgi:hypothetical protein